MKRESFITRLGLRGMGVVMFFSLMFLFVGTLLFSITFKNNYDIIFMKGGVLQIVVRLLVLGIASFLLTKVKISKKVFYICLAVYAVINVLFVILMGMLPAEDQYYLTATAADMLKGDFTEFAKFGYMDLYPHQFAFLEYDKYLFKIFGVNNYLAMQLLNVLYLLIIILCAVKIEELFDEGNEYKIGVVMMLFFPLSIYTTYIYGTLLSLAASMASIYFLVRLLKGQKCFICGLGIVFFNVAALLAKSNAIIFTIAESIIILLSINRSESRKRILNKIGLIVSLIVIYTLVTAGVHAELHTYTESDDVGTPQIAWIAMGLQTGGPAEGWHNCFVRDVYWNNDCNREIATELSKAAIKESFDYYVHNPKVAVTFFSKKLITLWTNPSFEAFMVLQRSHVRNPNTKIAPNPLRNFLLKQTEDNSMDAEHKWLNAYLKIYGLAIILGAMVYVLKGKLSCYTCVFACAFIGGFIFHTFWEAGSRYMLTYFVILIPYGVKGLHLLFDQKKDVTKELEIISD
ncbi:MAG: hypothetical protein K5679_10455 [Lachnospiraceae bacterium]|nr:hypothetical protein [Lachnospiraceae bacterium]